MAALARLRAPTLLRWVRSASADGSIFIRSMNAAAGKPAAEAGDDVVKAVFQRQQKNFRAYLDEISKSKLDLDANSEAAVKAYFDTQVKIRTGLGIPSYTQKISELLEGAAEEAPDVRTFLNIHSSLRREVGIEDDSGADALMLEALDKVEKSIGKTLVKDDANGMSAWKKELDQVNQKLGIDDAMLEKLEEEAEYAAAKAELEELRNTAMDRIDTYKRRDELTIEVDPKELDHRNYL
ncbi:probable ATP synthase 24 kDa subunit, mitochondrial [Physcomitrium patens]|uniref:Uncharacterized protein n=2 Tax=Physcomitrium patens TaxID=3218 RepID=A9RRT3_PHYPA|nr:probable ATP synthase 24 kDa subunit, mitochondrial [Physcomitrium patens]PNR47952.1 hypothetical protein PHYPA_012425 [Physcomitrium patens]|eukprot:XP_024385615.1 probable ATP synthase 24 kDa subunit, mitochondrial [Physcomitrella patens]